MSCFSFDMDAITALSNELIVEQQNVQKQLSDAKTQLQVLEAAVVKAVEEYQAAVEAYDIARNSALESYAKACASAAAQKKPNPAPPTFGPPPSDAGVRAAQAAVEAQQAVISALTDDLKALQDISNTMREMIQNVQSTEENITQFLVTKLLDIQVFSGVSNVGNIVAQTVLDYVKGVDGGYNYIIDKDGNKLYTDIYADMKASDYANLLKVKDAATVAALMAANNMGVELFYTMANSCGVTVTREEAEKWFNETVEYTDETKKVKIEDVLSAGIYDEDGVVVLDGSVVGLTGHVGQYEFDVATTGNAAVDKKILDRLAEMEYTLQWRYGAGKDCSSLCRQFYEGLGLTAMGWSAANQVQKVVDNGGTKLDNIDVENLKVGDLLEFNGGSHVGIYLGDGLFLHSSNTKDNVNFSTLLPTDATSKYGVNIKSASGYWGKHLTAAARPDYTKL